MPLQTERCVGVTAILLSLGALAVVWTPEDSTSVRPVNATDGLNSNRTDGACGAPCSGELCDDQLPPRPTDAGCCACPPEGWFVYETAYPATDRVAVRLTYRLQPGQANIHEIRGAPGAPLTMPAAYQAPSDFGAHVGGVSPAFYGVANNEALGYAELDSWLTLGVVDGSYPSSLTLSDPGGRLTGWTTVTPLYSEDLGVAVSSSSPHSPAFMGLIASRDKIVLAQVTHETAAGGPYTASAMLIGNTSTGTLWTHVAHWHWSL